MKRFGEYSLMIALLCLSVIKGMAHPKKKHFLTIYSDFVHTSYSKLWVSFFCRALNNIFWEMLETSSHWLPFYFSFLLWKSTAAAFQHTSCSTIERNSVGSVTNGGWINDDRNVIFPLTWVFSDLIASGEINRPLLFSHFCLVWSCTRITE